ncbi:MAG TPA: carboxypeptidase-like regulatory domain-containing protein, partial [Arachidicoccus sp.]
MRITIMLIFFAFIQVSAKTIAQKVTLSGSDLSFDKVFKTIEKQTDYLVIYDPQLLHNVGTLSLHAKDEQLTAVLNECFASLPITYEIRYNTIILKHKENFANLIVSSADIPEQTVIKGSVHNRQNQPLAGVSIQLLHTDRGSVSDADGNFSIEANVNDSLRFTSVGYINQTVNVGHNAFLNIIMASDSSVLDDIVMVGYGSEKKIDLTSAVQTVSEKQIKNRAVPNVVNILEGLAAGLGIQQTDANPGYGNTQVQ